MWPDEATLRVAWEALVADPTTAGEFAVLVLEPLSRALADRHRTASPTDIETAAGDALLELFRSPSRFDPDQRGLAGYLLMAADGDLRNLHAKERRHHRHRIPSDVVELDPVARNEDETDLPRWDSPAFQAALATLTPHERAVLELQRGGERRTTVFAETLGISDRTADEQAAEVKRVKDRALKRVQRAMQGTDHD